MLNRYALIVGVLLAVPLVLALPAATGYVNDFAGVISPADKAMMTALSQEVESQTTAEIAVATVTDTGDMAIEEYATALFNDWKIGKADKDNGLLILYDVDPSSSTHIRVETGYGLEGILPDGKVGRILDQYYVPQKGNVSKALFDTDQALAAVIMENKDEVLSGQAGDYSFSVNGDGTFLMLLLIIFVLPWGAAAIAMLPPKCDYCKVRMKKLRTDKVNDGLFATYYTIYRCPKCERVKRKKRSSGGAVFVAGGGFHGGGGFGGFGGGGSGGGGAGR